MGELSHLKSVLVVEDEGLIRIDLEDTLRNAGAANVIGAANIGEATAVLDGPPLDAAVLDLHLGRDGLSFDLARRLTELHVPFVFSSGSGEPITEFAHVPMLVKPFAAEDLVAALSAITDRSVASA